MAVALEQLREDSQLRQAERVVFELPSVVSLGLEHGVYGIDAAWVVRDESGHVTGISGNLEDALITVPGMGIGRASRLYNASAFQTLPEVEENDPAQTNPTFGDLFSDLSVDQLKLADIVLELEIVNQAGNSDEYAPDQV